jgi:(5-formylfuran-3-yl)methyl phosphate synthase
MAGLLVSVRDEIEAAAAVLGGARIIDVKEPSRGPLGRSDPGAWIAVRRVVPSSNPMSIALGELIDLERDRTAFASEGLEGIGFRKVGLAGLAGDPDWPRRWSRLISAWTGPPWVAVAYADHERADAPDPDQVIDAALDHPSCMGLLVDTWAKGPASPLEPSAAWQERLGRARAGGLLVALAGGLSESDLLRLAPLAPDLFAVRGAACREGHRLGPIDPERVARLARLAAEI